MLRKNINGTEYLFASYSNRFIDRDQEIITTESHQFNKRFTDIVATVGITPQLWWYHQPDLVFDAKAVAWGFDGNQSYCLFELSDSASKKIDSYESVFGDLILSHGFKPFEVDGKYINKHFTFEVSLLPKSAAANHFTIQERIKEASMPIQALPKEDQEKLLQLVDREVIEKHFSNLDETAQVLDDMGVESKAANVEETTEPETAEVETEPETTDEVEPIVEADDIIALANVVGDLVQQFAEFRANVEGEIKALKTAEQKRKAKAAPKTVKSVIRDIAALSKSAVGTAKPVDGRTTAAKAKPTAPKTEYDNSGWSVTSMRGGA